MKIRTPHHEKYFITLIDYWSRWIQATPKPAKSDTNDVIMTGINSILTEHTVKTILIDNGGEYVTARLEKYLAEKGNVLEKNVPYGVAERANGTLWEGATTAMADALKIPQNIWGYAVKFKA